MRTQGFTLPVHYVRHIAGQLGGMGVPLGEWLGRSGLTESRLTDPSLEFSFAVFQQLVRDAMELTREPALGLLVGERLVASTHGILGYAAVNSGTLRQALELFERYSRLRISLIGIAREVRGKEVRVCFTETVALGELQRPVLEAAVLSIKNLFESISMGAGQAQRAAFPFAAPEYAALARELFGCPVRYGQSWAGFSLPVDSLDVPLKMADPDAFREATEICQRELERLTANESLAARVQRLLLEKQNGFPSLQVTARHFHLTPRTLHRRLLDEGTSFRELLEEVRHTLAVEHLKSGRLSLEDLAYKLGYSDLANFRRAFKRWEAVAPSEFRAQRRTQR